MTSMQQIRFIGADGYAQSLEDDDKVCLAGITINAVGVGKLVRERLTTACSSIYRQYGHSAFVSTKRATAIHEAGHIVVGTVVGEKARYAFIEKSTDQEDQAQGDDGGWVGYTDFSAAPNLTTPQGLLMVARNLTAGVCAERMYDEDHRVGSSLDEMVMGQVMSVLASKGLGGAAEGDQAFWQAQVWDHVGAILRAHPIAMNRAGKSLFEHHRVGGNKLRQIIQSIKQRQAEL